MSSGRFVIRGYECEQTGLTHPVRVQEETEALEIDSVANEPSVVTTLSLPSAAVSRGKRTLGINCRTVTIKFTATKAGYKDGSPITLPWFQKGATFAAIAKGQVGTYQGTAIEVIGKSPEKVN